MALRGQASALNIWGDVNVSDLDRKKQLELVEKLRADALSDWTISGRLARIWAAMNWWRRDNPQLVVPTMITAADWKPVLPDRERTHSLKELGALFDAAAAAPRDPRYARDHWWRLMALAVGTASREAALTRTQVDLGIGRIRLNPEGRRQTKKRRPTAPIATTLARELESWSRDGEHVITWRGKPLVTPEFYDLLAETTRVQGGPNAIRHTVRTWLADYGVPSEDADVFVGHKPEGSATGKRYVHRRPEYLRTVVEGVEALYAALQPFVSRSFAGAELDEHPVPDSIDLSGLNVSRTRQLGKRRTAKLLCAFGHIGYRSFRPPVSGLLSPLHS